MTDLYRLTDIQVEEVSLVDRPANQWPFLVVKRDGGCLTSDGYGGYTHKNGSSRQDKALWSTAYMNDLPDSAFLYVKPGGEKDDSGKTVPRDNRMFPVRDKDGSIDLPHLRNAIARIPQSNLGQDLKATLQGEARRLLAQETEKSMSYADLIQKTDNVELDPTAVQKAVGDAMAKLSQVLNMMAIPLDEALKMDKYDLRYAISQCVDILLNAAKLEAMLGGTTAKAEGEPTAKADDAPKGDNMATEGTEKTGTEEAVDKAGKKLSQANADKLATIVSQLQTMLGMVSGDAAKTEESTAKTDEPAAKTDDSTAKTEEPQDTAKADMAALLKSVDQLTEVVKSQAAEIKALKAQAPVSNASTGEDVSKSATEDQTFWPEDMAKAVREGFFDKK